MIISDSAVQLSADHVLREQYERSESLTVWRTGRQRASVRFGDGRGEGEAVSRGALQEQAPDRLSISRKAAAQPRYVKKIAGDTPKDEMAVSDLKIRILTALIERLSGRKLVVSDPGAAIQKKIRKAEESGDLEVPRQQAGSDPATSGYGLVYEYHESYREIEKTTFAAEGVVTTADGREIRFSTQLSMSREFMRQTNIEIRAGEALKDPLVLNFNGAAAELSDTSFDFDIDMDGTEDHVRFLAAGSGFLALDRNRDGEITDGSELFGPATGNGFAELQAFDADRNGWIDENDEVYRNLRIWMSDDAGERTLFSLGQKGVGAIYLGHVDTPFSLKDEENEMQGEIRSSAIFLTEEGRAGTVQQLDLVI